jgi:hypothetical protein
VKLIWGLFAKLSVRLTQRKLAQALPIVGIAVGAGLNYTLMRKVGTAASFMYRERFSSTSTCLTRATRAPDLTDIIGLAALEDVPARDEPADGTDVPRATRRPGSAAGVLGRDHGRCPSRVRQAGPPPPPHGPGPAAAHRRWEPPSSLTHPPVAWARGD